MARASSQVIRAPQPPTPPPLHRSMPLPSHPMSNSLSCCPPPLSSPLSLPALTCPQLSALVKRCKLPPVSFAESHNLSALAMPIFSARPRAQVAQPVLSRRYSKAWQGAESHSGAGGEQRPISIAVLSRRAANSLMPRSAGGIYWDGTESHSATSLR